MNPMICNLCKKLETLLVVASDGKEYCPDCWQIIEANILDADLEFDPDETLIWPFPDNQEEV